MAGTSFVRRKREITRVNVKSSPVRSASFEIRFWNEYLNSENGLIKTFSDVFFFDGTFLSQSKTKSLFTGKTTHHTVPFHDAKCVEVSAVRLLERSRERKWFQWNQRMGSGYCVKQFALFRHNVTVLHDYRLTAISSCWNCLLMLAIVQGRCTLTPSLVMEGSCDCVQSFTAVFPLSIFSTSCRSCSPSGRSPWKARMRASWRAAAQLRRSDRFSTRCTPIAMTWHHTKRQEPWHDITWKDKSHDKTICEMTLPTLWRDISVCNSTNFLIILYSSPPCHRTMKRTSEVFSNAGNVRCYRLLRLPYFNDVPCRQTVA